LKHIIYPLSFVIGVTIIYQYDCWMSEFSLPHLLFRASATRLATFHAWQLSE
jgi:hypothetical protein